MCRWREALRRRRDGDGGFTLIEIIVAISLVGLAAAASVPLLITGLKSSLASRLNTQAKNLSQQRFESMRDLQFHVDRQNGPFVDLLDIYYTNLSTTAVTRTRAGETEVGKWISGGAAAPAPSGPFYQLTVASLPGNPAFSQTIDTQFLNTNGSALSASVFPNYDSQTEGKDQPPSLLVGVTVTTTWTDHAVSHSYTAYTRITDARGLVSSLTSQGIAELLRVSSTGQSGNALTVDVLSAQAGGGFSTGSYATADVRALQATDATGTDYQGASATATSPSGNSSQNSPVGVWTSAGSGSCGWVGSGPTQVADVTASTTNGLPQVPTDVDTASPPVHQIAAQLTSGSNGACGIFGFANQSTSYSSNLMLESDVPLVRINNDSSNSVVASASAWVNATSAAMTTTHSVTSGANASSTKRVLMFPGAQFVTDGLGVVDFQLTQSSIACTASVSSGTVTQSSTASYSVTVDYWRSSNTTGGGTRTTLGTYTWNSSTGTGSADPLAAINPANIVVYQNGTTVLHLSDYIASWSTARMVVENPNSGVHQLTGIVSVATQPVRDNDIVSAVGMQLGNLSCVADDRR